MAECRYWPRTILFQGFGDTPDHKSRSSILQWGTLPRLGASCCLDHSSHSCRRYRSHDGHRYLYSRRLEGKVYQTSTIGNDHSVKDRNWQTIEVFYLFVMENESQNKMLKCIPVVFFHIYTMLPNLTNPVDLEFLYFCFLSVFCIFLYISWHFSPYDTYY